ncbi:MAG: hypothetical protein QHC78_05295 [Pigmentiphaga sp.]|uniref:hypothetical protein n=1 Tax=Pigmentiphaga sp. TaxID=1977564 RepID=UPI0029BBBC27|nr:hypothetical protein [Pigmentiphaga sp.]MDX3905087.1 hypothetical protein [Pigmentiphaga sp.]
MLCFHTPRAWRAALLAVAGVVWTAAAGAAGPAPGHAPQRHPGSPCTPPGSDPLDASVPVPSAGYVSAFASYRRLGQTTIEPWKPANDEVGRIGGWRTYAREAAQHSPPERDNTPPPSCASGPLSEGGRP